MASKLNGWDLEGLRVNRQQMEQERDILNENRNFLEQMSVRISSDWKGDSSNIYLGDLKTDSENLFFIINAVDELIQKIKKIEDEIYQPCEDRIRAELGRMDGSIDLL